MARDHTRVNLDIWGDDEFRELPVDAQCLYWFLWTSPDRTYCGGHWWHPGKLTQFAADWTIPRVLSAGAVLSQRLFLIVDVATEECLLRSWIKHDGLWKVPNMAVSMANARAAMASKMCRGVIVHEVKKLADTHPTLSSWTRDEVMNLLSQKAIDAATLEPFNPDPNGGVNLGVNPPVNPDINPYGHNGVNPTDNPAPTTATPTPTATDGGYVSTEGHQRSDPEPPSEFCPKHPNDTDKNCFACGQARRTYPERKAAWDAAQRAAAAAARQAAIDNCPHCDEFGDITFEDSVRKCDHREVV